MEDTKKKENPKDKKSGAKVIKSQEPPVNKEKSKLYKRGEEALEEKYLGKWVALRQSHYSMLYT